MSFGRAIADEAGRQFMRFVLLAVVLSAGAGALAVWLLPKLWMWLKPLLLAALLAGCATTGTLVPVHVPVPVECREPVPQRPDMPTEQFSAKPALDQLLQGALAEIERREGYEIELRAALTVCTKPISP